VIVDEASQSGPEALFLNYIGKTLIVVGDDKQITPLHVGVDREQVDYLRRMHLQDIPYSQSLDLEGSLFAQAELRFPDRIRLREHFRCMPEIIQFSNNLSYSTEPLIPLRQYGGQRQEPVKTVHVKDGYRKGSAGNVENRPEPHLHTQVDPKPRAQASLHQNTRKSESRFRETRHAQHRRDETERSYRGVPS
jgi:hypothetical protein